MRVYLKKPRCGVYAEGEYDLDTGHLMVKEGARVSLDVRKYKGRLYDRIIMERKDVIKDGILIKDLEFNSPSGAGVFVTGRSTNGLRAWRDEKGRNLNQVLGRDEFI